MAGYDPKQKRAHSTAPAAGPAPVDDLLGAPAPPRVPDRAPAAEAAPSTSSGAPTAVDAPRVTPPLATGPDPKVLAVAAGVVVLAVVLWRRRR